MYNCESCVESFLIQVSNQDYENIEIICVVEESEDNTLNIVNICAKDDNRIVVIRQKHQGAGVARNNGMTHCKGKYLCFFDVDDYISNKYTSKMYEAITKNNVDIVICEEGVKKTDGSIFYNRSVNKRTHLPYYNKVIHLLLIDNYFYYHITIYT